MAARHLNVVRTVLAAAALLAQHAVHAETGPGIAGDYVCRSDCHPSDAPPSIEINGTTAMCRNDLGGVFFGQVLSRTSIACFNQTGTLSPDGTTIVWSNGGVWERRR